MNPNPTADVTAAVTAALEGQMTNAEYVNTLGLSCPKCKAKRTVATRNITRRSPTVVTEGRKCSICSTEWTEVYDLTGYEDKA